MVSNTECFNVGLHVTLTRVGHGQKCSCMKGIIDSFDEENLIPIQNRPCQIIHFLFC